MNPTPSEIERMLRRIGLAPEALRGAVSGGRKNSRLSSRLIGGTGASLTAQSNSTRIVRREAEAPWRRVRFHFYNVNTAAATGNIKIAAAATDTLAEGTVALRSQPHRNGVAFASLAADAASPGWVPGTFGGAASAPIPIAPSAQRDGVLTSDWLDISSVPRTDVPGGRPGLLLRVHGDIIWSTSGNITTDGVLPQTAWRNNQSAYWYRVNDLSTFAGDGVADLTQNGGSISNIALHMAFEFDYDVPGLAVMAIGDSLSEATYERGKFAPWQRAACALVSSQSCPVEFMNLGHSGLTAEQFDTRGLDSIALLRPTHIFHQAYSPNPSATAPSAARQALSMSRLNRTLAAAREVGARVCVWTPVPNSAWDAAADAGRLALRQALISRASFGEFDLLDLESIVSNGATPARIPTAYNLDGTHYNGAAMDGPLAEAGAAYLRQFTGL